MLSDPQNGGWKNMLLAVLAIVSVSLFLTLAVWFSVEKPHQRRSTAMLSDVNGTVMTMFSQFYPVNDRFKEELQQLRSQGKLNPENEILIQRTIHASAPMLNMPPSVLWCLLFQESRLNHLEGIEEAKASSGLGQFSYFSFYEFNNHLDRFGDENIGMVTKLLGRDVRPVEPRKSDIYHPSSYYFIPTAVVSSASYLNNRYLHLKSLLEKQGIPYSSELLWLYAAMAYNKGTRSVISLWNEVRRRGGKRALERAMMEKPVMFSLVSDTATLTQILNSIWPSAEANRYARELRIHLNNMADCTLASQDQDVSPAEKAQ